MKQETQLTDFHDWIKDHPPPNLQELVARFGTYSAITPDAWAEFDAAREDWEYRRKNRLGQV